MSNIDTVRLIFRAIADRDVASATRHLDAARYVEHDPRVGAGVAGVARYIAGLAPDARLDPVRIFEDAPYVVVQSTGQVRTDGTFFDVFRFESALVVEHWGFAAPAGSPNRSGHTQVDGPTEANRDVDAARTKALVRDYYETVHLSGRHDQIPRFMPSGRQTRHEPGVEDGVDAFARDLAIITRDRTIDEIRLLVGQGDFVFLVAKGTYRGEPCAYVDLYRVEDGELIEHWGFPEPFSPAGTTANGHELV